MAITKPNQALGATVFFALSLFWTVVTTAPAEAADVKFYGNINYIMSHDENASGETIAKAKNNGSAVGVKVKEQVAKGIDAFAKIELSVDTEDSGSTPFDSKLAFAGLDLGNMGVISAGRQNSPFYSAVNKKTDVFPEYGARAPQKLNKRDSHTLLYSNSIGNIVFDNMFKVDGETGKDGIDTWESALFLPLSDNLDLGLGYSDDKVNDAQYYGTGVTVGITESTKVGYNYTVKHNANDTEDISNDIVVQHTLNTYNGVCGLGLENRQCKTTLMAGYSAVKDGNAWTTLGVKRKLNKKLELYGAYEMKDNASGKDTDGMSVGLKLKF